MKSLKKNLRTSLVVQSLRLCSSSAEDIGLILGWGTKILHVKWQKKKERKKFNR